MSSSWFSLSLPNPFTSDDDDDDQHPPPDSPTAATLTQTLGRQLHSVASFLAPPPSSSPPPDKSAGDYHSSSTSSSSSSYLGMKNDLAEIGGSFKTGLSLLSSNKTVSGISKFASSLLRFDQGSDLEEFEAVGITDEVVDFVREISRRPECWIDFPFSLQHKDFDMSDVQKDHATAIEQLVPSLTALRHKVNGYMSEEQFWMIYFILLLPRLNEDDYGLLSTPEVVQVRDALLQKLRNKNTPVEFSENPRESENSTERIKNPLQETKSSAENADVTQRTEAENHENPKFSDVSFSDLDLDLDLDDDNDVSGGLSTSVGAQSSNVSETGDWVRLNESERKAGQPTHREDSSGWLTIDGVDSDT